MTKHEQQEESHIPTRAEQDAEAARIREARTAARKAQGTPGTAKPKAAVAVAEEKPKAKKASKKAAEARPVCAKRKLDGTACSAKCMKLSDGSIADHCTDHRPPHAHLSEATLALLAGHLGIDDRATLERIVAFVGWGKVDWWAKQRTPQAPTVQ